MNKAKGTANYEKEACVCVCVCEVGQILNLIIVVVTEAFDCGHELNSIAWFLGLLRVNIF